MRSATAPPTLVAVPVPGSWRVEAVLRVAGDPAADQQPCQLGDVQVLPGVTLSVPGGLRFAVTAVRPDVDTTTVEAVVQFVDRPEVLDLVAVGDADTADLFTGISRDLDKALWFLEAHNL